MPPDLGDPVLGELLDRAGRSQRGQLAANSHCVSSPKARFIEGVRKRIRCERRRSRSRIARSSSGATHTVGMRSRWTRSASTRASTRSVVQANGAIALTCGRRRSQSSSRTRRAGRGPRLRRSPSRCSPGRPDPSGRQVAPARPPCLRPLAARAQRAPGRAAGPPVDAEILHVILLASKRLFWPAPNLRRAEDRPPRRSFRPS